MKKQFLLTIGLILIFSSFLVVSQKSNSEYTQKVVWNTIHSIEEQENWIYLDQEATALSLEIPRHTQVFVQFEEQGEWMQIGSGERHRHEEILNSSSPVAAEEEELLPETPDFSPNDQWTPLQFTAEPFQKFRFRVEGETPQSIEFSFIDTRREEPLVQVATNGAISGGSSGLKIISRSEWGADETLRYSDDTEIKNPSDKDGDVTIVGKQLLSGCDNLHLTYPDEFEITAVTKKENGHTLTWPYQYSEKIEKVVIHHTAATFSEDRDPREVMRGIYAYHTRSRGWGDIGYNYVIDPFGNIYQGRAGGDFVVGGHVYCANVQTIGIALMGNFQDTEPTEDQLSALGELLPFVAQKYELDLSESSKFHGELLPNLLGHRDLGSTACPGENMYTLLQKVRTLIKNSDVIQRLKEIDRSSEFTGKIDFLELKPGEERTITLQFKNTGNVTWGSDTWLYVVNPKTGATVRSKRPPKTYIAALMEESRVQPGQTATFVVTIQGGYEGGIYSLLFNPVVDGRKISGAEIIQPLQVIAPQWGVKFDKSQVKVQPQHPLAGARVGITLPLRNIGDTRWKKDSISLQLFANGKTYVSQMTELSVLSGGVGNFTFSLDPFPEEKKYLLRGKLLVNGKAMSGVSSLVLPLEIGQAEYKSQLLTEKILKITLSKSGTVETRINVMNTGNTAWSKNDTKLVFLGSGQKYEFEMEETTVKPQEIAHFVVSFVPNKKGILQYSFWLQKGSRKIFGLEKTRLIVRSNKTPQKSSNQNPKPEVPTDTNQESTVNTKDLIRIRLGYKNDFAQISSSGDFQIQGDGKNVGTVSKNINFDIKKSGNSVSLNQKNYSKIQLIPQNDKNIFTISSWERRPSWDSSGKINDNEFRGVLELRVYEDELIIINEIPLEEYLRGVGEVSNDAPVEKLKTMSILARTYAAFYIQEENEKFPGAPYDGDDSPERFQKYLGYSYEKRSPNFINAVEQTKDLVVTYKGALIKTPYFNQSNGRTKSAEEVWGWKNTPYLQSVADPLCPEKIQKGHGVGLSGCGATEAAKQGKDYEEIIKYYYQGVEVEKLK